MSRLLFGIAILVNIFFHAPAFAQDKLDDFQAFRNKLNQDDAAKNNSSPNTSAGTAPSEPPKKDEVSPCSFNARPKFSHYRNIQAVGLSLMGLGAKEYEGVPKAFIRESFIRRIREQILPFVESNENCEIPDLEIFETVRPNSGIYLNEFMQRPGTLTILVQLEMFPSPANDAFNIFAKKELKIAVLRFNSFLGSAVPESRSNSWEIFDGGLKAAFLVDTPRDQVEKLITSLVKNILVLTPENDVCRQRHEEGPLQPNDERWHQKQEREQREEKILKEKPPTPRIHPPSPSPEKNSNDLCIEY